MKIIGVVGVRPNFIREHTERPVTVTQGTNRSVGTAGERIVKESLAILNGVVREHKFPELWDGKAADRVINVIADSFSA